MHDTKLLISKKEAAQLLSISLRMLDYLISAGEIRIRRVGRRCLIETKELQRFARRDHTLQAEIGASNDGNRT